MTKDQAQRLKLLMSDAFEQVLGGPIAFVMVTQDEELNVEVLTNAAHREQLPLLLRMGMELVQHEPAGTTKDMRH